MRGRRLGGPQAFMNPVLTAAHSQLLDEQGTIVVSVAT